MKNMKVCLIKMINQFYELTTRNLRFSVILSISLVWTYGAFYILLADIPRNEENGIIISDVGSYLAGAFSPLAFFLLIAGHFNQEKSLRVLIDQKLKEERRLHNKSQPSFNTSIVHSDPSNLSIEITNNGASVKDLNIFIPIYDPEEKTVITSQKWFPSVDNKFTLDLNLTMIKRSTFKNSKEKFEYVLPISFLDEQLNRQTTKLTILHHPSSGEVHAVFKVTYLF